MKKDSKPNRSKFDKGQTLPLIDNSSFNQTIIINNPKININYIEQINNIGAKIPKNQHNTTGYNFKK